MRAVVMHEPGNVTVEETPMPTILEPTDAIIKLAATCICGSDLWPYRGAQPVHEQRMGHEYVGTVVEAGVDLLVIRGSVVSAEHVSGNVEPLNLKRFIYELDVPVVVGGVTTYTAALHLMRTGAAAVLVGQGGGASSSIRQVLGLHMPMATAVADVAAARRDYLDESGGRYVHVIADGSVGNSGDVVKAIACGADAVMLGAALARAEEAPGGGYHWGAEARHERLPRGFRSHVGTVGTMAEILNGPSDRADGTLNLMGALRRTLATTGYADVKELQRVEVVLAPYTGS